MDIAILGWGSLVWDPRELPHYGPWKLDGPRLPIEFSRVSKDGRLTLVIDVAAPSVPTRFAISPRTDVSDAVEDLRLREGTGPSNIGFVIASTGENSRTRFPQQADAIKAIRSWCASNEVAACVWTALPPNFRDELGDEFSPDRAIGYLETLGKSARDNALRYIRNAPKEVDTPLRRRVSEVWPVLQG